MKKVLFFTLMLIGVFVHANTEDKIKDFIKNTSRADIVFDYIKVKSEFENLKNSWKAYLVEIKVSGNEKVFEDIFFTDGTYVSQGLININTFEDMRNTAIENFSKKLDESFYEPTNLIYGESKFENRMVIFSDPLCPICIQYFNELEKAVERGIKTAIYYYPFPLTSLHPTATTLVKASYLYELKNHKKIDFELYSTLNNETLYSKARNSDEEALNVFNQIFKTNYKIEDLNNKEVTERLNKSISKANSLNINGTPTVYFNDVLDSNRNKIFITKEEK